jgi:hypothetical protein
MLTQLVLVPELELALEVALEAEAELEPIKLALMIMSLRPSPRVWHVVTRALAWKSALAAE